MATVCNDYQHLFSCRNSGYYVRPFSFEPTDNWYQTKLEFLTSANALFLSDHQRVCCFHLCLVGLAKTLYIEVLKQLSNWTFENLIIALDQKFNFYHPLRTANLAKLCLEKNESVGEFGLRVEFEVRDLYYLPTVVQDQLIFDTIMSGVPEPMQQFVLDSTLGQRAPLDYMSLIQFCKMYEQIKFFVHYDPDNAAMKNVEKCKQCPKVILLMHIQCPQAQAYDLTLQNEQWEVCKEVVAEEHILCEELFVAQPVDCGLPSQAEVSIFQAPLMESGDSLALKIYTAVESPTQSVYSSDIAERLPMATTSKLSGEIESCVHLHPQFDCDQKSLSINQEFNDRMNLALPKTSDIDLMNYGIQLVATSFLLAVYECISLNLMTHDSSLDTSIDHNKDLVESGFESDLQHDDNVFEKHNPTDADEGYCSE